MYRSNPRAEGRPRRLRWSLLALGVVVAAAGAFALVKRDWLKTFRQEGRCRKGSQEDCIALALRLASGDGVRGDHQRAQQLWAIGMSALDGKCMGGDLQACLRGASLARAEEHRFPQPGLALRLAVRACELGSEPTCMDEAQRLAGRGRAEDEQAFSLRAKACEHGHSAACLHLGELYRHQHIPSPVHADPPTARQYLEKACDRGSGDGCSQAGEMYQRGEGGAVQVQRAVELYRRAVPLLDAECQSPPTERWGLPKGDACHTLGILREKGRGTGVDLQRALDAWKLGCEAGGSSSCLSLGVPPKKIPGLILERFDTGPVSSAVRACGEGQASSCVRAADAYAEGRGVPENGSEADRLRLRAAQLFRDSCNEGQALACTALGDVLKSEIAGKRDLAGAVAAYEQAASLRSKKCDSGEWVECDRLARMYLDGRVVGQDLSRGWELLNRVVEHHGRECDSGADPKRRRAGCSWLAFSWELSDVRPRDPVQALRYYRRCCELETGDDRACCKSAAKLEQEVR
ncbi:MAG: sel1 repeat family protein [Deltaproteobacteria bacterium]|nr:sel1 repeat family protein [Deltaproteobacteria bacterium]